MAIGLKRWNAIVRAEMKIPPGLRNDFVWYMNEATFRELADSAGHPIPPDEPIKPEGIQMFGMPIEIVESRKILLVMKVE